MDVTFRFARPRFKLFPHSGNRLCGVAVRFCLLKRVVSTTSVLSLLFEVLGLFSLSCTLQDGAARSGDSSVVYAT